MHIKDGFPAALSSSCPSMKKGHLRSTSLHTEPHTSTWTVSRGSSTGPGSSSGGEGGAAEERSGAEDEPWLPPPPLLEGVRYNGRKLEQIQKAYAS